MTIFLVDMVSPFRLLPASEVTLSGDDSEKRCKPGVSDHSTELLQAVNIPHGLTPLKPHDQRQYCDDRGRKPDDNDPPLLSSASP